MEYLYEMLSSRDGMSDEDIKETKKKKDEWDFSDEEEWDFS